MPPALQPDHLPFRSGTPGQAKVGFAVYATRPIVSISIDASDSQLKASDGEALALAATTALEKRRPLVAEISASGTDIDEGVAAIHGWGHAARAVVRCSGVVPVVIAVDGPVVVGPALLLGLADILIMTSDSYAFVSGPQMVRQFTGEVMSNAELGGAAMHERTSGLASLVVDDMDLLRPTVAELLAYLPSHNDELAPLSPSGDPVDRPIPELDDIIPASATGSYDVRHIVETIVDIGTFVELRGAFAPNLVTGFAFIDGRSVGIVANQPQALAGTLDIAASQKGGRFVALCDAFNVPLVTLVDTSGFYPGKDLEWRGMIRYGAQMAFAYARATVPRVNLTLRKSYGGAYIVMDSKYMGNDLAFAWPTAEIAVMGAKGAVEILHRRSSPEDRVALERAYEDRLLNPYIAAERGSVDRIIKPADTRRELAAALERLASKRERLPHRRHDNTPL